MLAAAANAKPATRARRRFCAFLTFAALSFSRPPAVQVACSGQTGIVKCPLYPPAAFHAMSRKKPDAFGRLTDALKILPNVGPKSARRMAYELLRHKRDGAAELAAALQHALTAVQHCRLCNTFCEGELCPICADENRDPRRLMIVHLPADVAGMEAANCHDGLYFVLMGQISPAQGMDLQHIALDKLVARLQNSPVEEVIIATAFTPEGNATAYVLAELFKTLPYRVSRLAHGMPLGSELEYIDAGTLAQSVYERKLLKEAE